MKWKNKKYLTSGRAKRIYIVFAALLVFFFGLNDLLLPWYVNSGGVITVPPVVGISFDTATRLLDSLGFESRKGDVRLDRAHPAGVVIIQNPVDGSKVKKGRRIYLTVSGGEVTVQVPNIKGRTLRDARFQLEHNGLKLGGVEYESSAEYPANTIIEQKIIPGTNVKRDVYISVIVSQGSSEVNISVPDVTGKTLSEASKILSAIGLKVGNITYIPSSDLLPNTVVDQYPRMGEKTLPDRSVDLILVQSSDMKKEILEN